MRHIHWLGIAAVVTAISGALVATAIAQQPGGGGRGGPPPDPIREALDTNHDHQLDADEIKNASTSLLKIDKDGDGSLNHDEFRPPMPPRFQGPLGREGEGDARRGPGGQSGRGPGDPHREGGPEGRSPREGRDGPGPGGPVGNPGRSGPPSSERFIAHAMTFDTDGDGKLGRDELKNFADEMGRRQGGAGPGAPEDGPRPPRRPE